MKSPVVLAFAGGIHASAAIPWLIDTYGVEVVTVTLDVGQGQDLGELRARALACGASRAHLVDARDEFARELLFPSLFTPGRSTAPDAISALPRPLIARKLVEIARIEGAEAIGHGAADAAFDDEIRTVDASMRVIAPAREWSMDDAELVAYARARQLPTQAASAADCRVDQNLWGRQIAWDGDHEPIAARSATTCRRLDEPAIVDIHFERGVPTAVNSVPMSPAELIECLALIGGQHGVGRTNVTSPERGHLLYDAPAATVLLAAASAAGRPATADVCLRLTDGEYTVLSPADRESLLVNYA
jgi:argininosuccinate synthase